MIKFKYFVNISTPDFAPFLKKIVTQDSNKKTLRSDLWFFKNKYNSQLKIFEERLKEIRDVFTEEVNGFPDDENKEEKVKEVNNRFSVCLNELLETDSELDRIDYKMFEDFSFSPLEMDLLENICFNMPIPDSDVA